MIAAIGWVQAVSFAAVAIVAIMWMGVLAESHFSHRHEYRMKKAERRHEATMEFNDE